MPSVSDTYIENRQRVQPTHTNNYESAHGGNVVKWMDEIGAMSAMRAAGETCVTAKINELDFKRPVPQGDTCIIESYVYAVGRTSLRTRIRAYRESPRTGDRQLTTESFSCSLPSTRTGRRRRSRSWSHGRALPEAPRRGARCGAGRGSVRPVGPNGDAVPPLDQ